MNNIITKATVKRTPAGYQGKLICNGKKILTSFYKSKRSALLQVEFAGRQIDPHFCVRMR
jgi:hypothetical protein